MNRQDYRAAFDAIPFDEDFQEKTINALRQRAGQAPERKVIFMKKNRFALIAALAVCCAALLGAASEWVFPLLTGGHIVMRADGSYSATNAGSELQDPIVLEDGRLWFVANGERSDVTDLIDEETPYLYSSSSESSDMTNYIAVGGTPEQFGWAEWLQTEKDGQLRLSISSGTRDAYWLHEGQLYDPGELSAELQAAWDEEGSSHPAQIVYRAWYLAAVEQLGLERPEPLLSDNWRGNPVPG